MKTLIAPALMIALAAPASAQQTCIATEAGLRCQTAATPAAQPQGEEIVVPIMVMAAIAALIIGSGGAAAPLAVVSDERLKSNIVDTGRVEGGLPIHRWSYAGFPHATFEGVMAQDVLALRPEAVVTGPGDYMMVDYGMLGIELRRID